MIALSLVVLSSPAGPARSWRGAGRAGAGIGWAAAGAGGRL